MLAENDKLLIDDLTSLMIRVRKNWQKTDEEVKNPLTPPKYLLLYLIYKNQKLSASDLGKQMGLSSGSITTAVNKLVSNHLLTRKRDIRDRRVTWLELTDEGKQIIEDMFNIRQELWLTLFEKLSKDERDQFHLLLNKLTSN
ncbi:MarR family winged helix-turn-helix transcriptional regulator [Gottfriedia sp. NPDC056225]|uniref:MarR family winged helix-turn-helix transcriptional regulator n=1 Tax=Gottfriedia sp. NPDC056225 TaxID=3345751 RepID=UPI001558F9DF|nr:MarR family transcriptional regulator [Arthrobacter citreus]